MQNQCFSQLRATKYMYENFVQPIHLPNQTEHWISMADYKAIQPFSLSLYGVKGFRGGQSF